MRSMKKFLLILPLLAGILWGSSGTFVRKLEEAGFSSATVLSSRVLGAVLMLGLFLLLYDRSLFRIRLKDLWVFLGSGLLGMLGLNLFYNEAIARLHLSLAALLLGLSPVFVMFLAALLFHERITGKKLGCIALAILGCILVSGVLEQSSGTALSLSGVLMGLLAALFSALYSVFSRLGVERGYHSFTITFYSLLFLALVLLPFTDWSTVGQYAASAPGHVLYLLLHSLCTSVLPYLLYTLGLQYVETGIASLLSAGGEPTAAAVFGAIIYQELPTPLTLLGLAITIAALALLCAPGKKKPQIS